MTKTPSVSAIPQQHNSTTSKAGSGTEPAFDGVGFAASPVRSGDKTYATHLRLGSSARDYASVAFCPFSAGQYTEF